MKIEFEPIGYVRSDIKTTKDAPRHFSVSDREGVIEINPRLKEGLYRIEDREHLVILFHFHDSGQEYDLHQFPPTGSGERGVFSTCSPHRPNSIGMSIVKLLKVEGNKLHVRHIDMIDGTPVIDVKPFKGLK